MIFFEQTPIPPPMPTLEMNSYSIPRSNSNKPDTAEPKNLFLDSIRKGTTLKVTLQDCLFISSNFKTISVRM